MILSFFYRICGLLSVAVLLAFGAFGVFALAYAQDKAVPIVQEQGRGGDIGALARIEPTSRVIRVAPPNNFEGSRVENLQAVEGDVVKKGDLIGYFATYHRDQAELSQARARLETEQASLARVKAGNKVADIRSQQSQVNALIAREENAKKEFDRVADMYKNKAISRARYDRALSDIQSLQAERAAAEAALASLETVRGDDVQVASARVKEAEAQVAIAMQNVALSEIRAPIDGTILKIYARVGESAGNKGILDMADLTQFEAAAEVFETDITRVKMGASAEVRVPGMAAPLRAHVVRIGHQVEQNNIIDPDPNRLLDTRVIEVRLGIDDVDPAVLSHLIHVKVDIVIHP